MSYPGEIARRTPERPAIVMAGSGEAVSYGELDERINRLSHLLRSRGVGSGDGIAIFCENHPRFHEVAWAAQLSGLCYTAVNSHLTADEAAYIVNDCGASVLVSSAALAPVAEKLTRDVTPHVHSRLMLDDAAAGWESYEELVGAQPSSPIADQSEGDFVLYSSGTTGLPKGIKRPLTFAPPGEKPDATVAFLQMLGFVDGDVYLSPAPLYHAAPLAWTMGVHRLGGTVVVMERFDPAAALELVERYRVTHSQMVPTMFVRMLKLPDDVRGKFDTTSLRAVVHAAAPCPVEIKRRMIEWWGPIIAEYYSATEGMGATFVVSDDWLAHPGTVGRAVLGTAHILDEDGQELPTGEPGTVWFEGGNNFEYLNDADKTKQAKDHRGWATVGDVGYLDADGYLYLTDRKAYMIISGGVNIYPQEAESQLVNHPKVMDVAVFGVPNEDLGEEVKAVVQPVVWADAGPDLEQELIDFCRQHLATYKCPRTIDFDRELPRLDSGKLYKRLLRDRYWAAAKA